MKSTEGKTALKTSERADRGSSLVAALQDVSDGVVTLVRQHLELAKYEAAADAKRVGKQASVVAVGGLVALIGYMMLLLTLVLGAGLVGAEPLTAMVITAGVLTLLHLVIGGVVINRALAVIREKAALDRTQRELDRSSQWAKQITTEKPKQLTSDSP